MDFLDPLKVKVLPSFDEADRDCTLHFDEMSIKSQRCYDPGTNSYIGDVTLEGVEGLATVLEVYSFAGIQRKWELNAAYHFTPSEGNVATRAKVVLDLLQYAEENGLNVIAVVCDMGNRGVLAELGFNTTRDRRKYSIVHPFNNNKSLFVVPDVVHVFKCAKDMLVNKKVASLSAEIVSKYNLPTSEIEFAYVELLVDFQEDNMDIKFAPRLTKKDLSKSHFNKMNTASACHIFGDKTAAGIDFLADENVFQTESKTTAWPIKLINKWFVILLSRNLVRALSLKNMEACEEAIGTLESTIEVFSSLTVGSGWKPVQTHLIMATEALTDISYFLLFEKKYSFVFMGRFTNDISENIFSAIRMNRPTPTAVEAKYSLKMQTLSQCSRKVLKSQDSHDDRSNLMSLKDILDYLESKKSQPIENSEHVVLSWTEPVPFPEGTCKGFVLYRMCGYVLHSMRRNGQFNCDDCFSNLQHQEETPLPLAKWTQNTDFTEGAQIRVSLEVFNLFQAIEFNLVNWKRKILKARCNVKALIERSILPALVPYNIPSCVSCPNLKEKISSRFAVMRLKQMEKAQLKEKKPGSGSSFASKSMAYRVLAANYVGKRQNVSDPGTSEKSLK